GYRYFETRYYDYVTGRENTGEYIYDDDVCFSFGYGESYADFAYSDFKVTEKEDGDFEITVTVTNIGDETGNEYQGKEVVEVYLQKPYTDYDIEHGVEKAAAELVGYGKTDTLYPQSKALDGQMNSQEIKITVPRELLKSYDSNYAKTYILEDGNYYFAIGNGAHDAVNNILAYQSENAESGVDVDVTKMTAPGSAKYAAEVMVVYDQEEFAVSVKDAGSKLAKSTYLNAEGEYAEITNALDNADLNKYIGEGTITYVSRNDWEGTMPQAAVIIEADAVIDGLKNSDAVTEDPDAVMPSYGKNNGLTLAMLRGSDYNDESWEELLDQMSFGEQSNLITNGYYSTKSISSVSLPSTNASDGPTGIGTSIGGLAFPSEGIWASSFNDDLVERLGEVFALEALANGKTNVYAPGVNIHRMAFGGRSHEYFSEDPFLTGMIASKEISGLQSNGVVATVKHFAFNDEEDQRAGISVWLNEQEAREIMLAAFQYALAPEEGNAGSVMNSFNRAGTVWVGAHESLMDIMRNEWGFNGFCITDMAVGPAAEYMTYINGIPAGTNLFLGSGDETTLSEYQNSPTFSQKMRESSHRILYTIANYSAEMNGISSDTKIEVKAEWWRTLMITAAYVLGALSIIFIALYICSIIYVYKKDKIKTV
ncbi:MAG: fibronectin type III-like domain-contianing protein, partial [Parasporobacterium sp.]|nr:fibronectin type III-like domain-contianing protein [Parasporobacterium sp.]